MRQRAAESTGLLCFRLVRVIRSAVRVIGGGSRAANDPHSKSMVHSWLNAFAGHAGLAGRSAATFACAPTRRSACSGPRVFQELAW